MAVGRSENMRRIRSKDTSPEVSVRQLVHRMGFRYRLHRKDLPGKPDLVFASRKKVVFVHGCFWHQHPGCNEGRLPKSNVAYWMPKLRGNVRRDQEALERLGALGWHALVVWECEVKETAVLAARLKSFLTGSETRQQDAPKD